MFKKLLTILSLSVLAFAVVRFLFRFKTPTFSSQKQSQIDRFTNDADSDSVSRRKNRLRLPVAVTRSLNGSLNSDQELFVFQETEGGHRCFYGLYAFQGTRNQNIHLRAIKSFGASKLVRWAILNKVQVSWMVMPPPRGQSPIPFVQTCEKWFPATSRPIQLSLFARRGEIFINSSEFSSIRQHGAGSPGLKIKEDILRRGWRIIAPDGHHEFVVQSAKTGLNHKLIVYSSAENAMKTPKINKKLQKTLNKSFGLPGWD